MAVKLILNFVLKGKKKNQNNQHSFLLYHKSIQYTLTINLGTCIELKKSNCDCKTVQGFYEDVIYLQETPGASLWTSVTSTTA